MNEELTCKNNSLIGTVKEVITDNPDIAMNIFPDIAMNIFGTVDQLISLSDTAVTTMTNASLEAYKIESAAYLENYSQALTKVLTSEDKRLHELMDYANKERTKLSQKKEEYMDRLIDDPENTVLRNLIDDIGKTIDKLDEKTAKTIQIFLDGSDKKLEKVKWHKWGFFNIFRKK